MKETRYILKPIKNFAGLKATRTAPRTVWYFDNYKIMKLEGHYTKIKDSQYGVAEKVKTQLTDKEINVKDFDFKCKFKMDVIGKDVKDFYYIEKVKVTPNLGRSFEFFSTEVEDEEQKKMFENAPESKIIKVIKDLGNTSMKEILEKKLYK